MSFSQAATQLNLVPSAVSRQISELEKHLGVRLLQRTTRSINLTEDGKRYLGEEIIHADMISDTADKETIQSVEAEYIAQLLIEHNGHRRKVADILKNSERTLYRKLVNYNLTGVGKST